MTSLRLAKIIALTLFGAGAVMFMAWSIFILITSWSLNVDTRAVSEATIVGVPLLLWALSSFILGLKVRRR